jgi:hypothetical protein
MTPIPVDKTFNETEAWSGSVYLRPGAHIVRVVEAKDDEPTKKNNHPQLILNMEAIAGDEQGASTRDWITVIPATYGKVKQVAEAFGVEIANGVDAKAFVGKVAKIVVRPEEKRDGSGGTVDRVQAYKALNDAEKVQATFPGAKEIKDGDGASGAEEDVPF